MGNIFKMFNISESLYSHELVGLKHVTNGQEIGILLPPIHTPFNVQHTMIFC